MAAGAMPRSASALAASSAAKGIGGRVAKLPCQAQNGDDQ